MLIGRNRRRTEDVNQVTEASSGRNPCGTPAFSGSHSASTSGSASSPCGWNEQAAVATPAKEPDFVRRMNQLDMHGDEAGSSQGTVSGKKKKRGTRAAACDKSGRGLRQFSMKVCEKVESKGTTTYNEVADEVVAEFAEPNNDPVSPDQQQYDEKNIRRRVYDALNVLMAMDIISKDKKEIQWKGLPRSSLNNNEELKIELAALSNRIDKKTAHLQELENQIVGLQNLIQRNAQLHGTENGPLGGVVLPFILVQTQPHATVEVEISEDMQLVHFDFNSTPFELHDDAFVLKAMRFCEREPNDSAHQPGSNGGEHLSTVVTFSPLLQQATGPSPNSAVNLSTPTTIPGILKTGCNHEQRNQ